MNSEDVSEKVISIAILLAGTLTFGALSYNVRILTTLKTLDSEKIIRVDRPHVSALIGTSSL